MERIDAIVDQMVAAICADPLELLAVAQYIECQRIRRQVVEEMPEETADVRHRETLRRVRDRGVSKFDAQRFLGLSDGLMTHWRTGKPPADPWANLPTWEETHPDGSSEPLPPPVCSVAGCEIRKAARGLCQSHYRRLRKYGDVRADVPVGQSLVKDPVTGRLMSRMEAGT